MEMDFLLKKADAIEKLANAFNLLNANQELDSNKQKSEILDLISITAEHQQVEKALPQ